MQNIASTTLACLRPTNWIHKCSTPNQNKLTSNRQGDQTTKKETWSRSKEVKPNRAKDTYQLYVLTGNLSDFSTRHRFPSLRSRNHQNRGRRGRITEAYQINSSTSADHGRTRRDPPEEEGNQTGNSEETREEAESPRGGRSSAERWRLGSWQRTRDWGWKLESGKEGAGIGVKNEKEIEGSDRAPRRNCSAIQRLPDFISLSVLFFF